VDCTVGDWAPWGDWGAWNPTCGPTMVNVRSRPVNTPQACHGSPCGPTMEHNTTTAGCPQDCVVDEWGSWSLCPSCVSAGADPGSQTRFRAILIHPANGGENCPYLTDTLPCLNVSCDVDCTVGDWAPWGDCSVICGDGYETKTRSVIQNPYGAGMACPPLTETQYCFQPCQNCILGPLQYGPCAPTCSNSPNATGYRQVTRGDAPLVQVLPDGTKVTLTMCPFTPTLEPCSLPCCPVDCVMSIWSVWGDCNDGVQNRTRTIDTYPSCGGAGCPDCRLEKDVCTYVPPADECGFGDACEEGFAESQSDDTSSGPAF